MEALEEAIVLKDALLLVAEIFGALAVISGAVFAAYKWILKQNKQDKEIKDIKEEQTLITYGVLAALKGLKEQGCNGPVTEAINKIEKHLNIQAHQ